MSEGQPPESGEVTANRWGALNDALAEKKEPFLSRAEVRLALQRSGTMQGPLQSNPM